MKGEKKLEGINIPELNEAYNQTLNWFFSFPNSEMGLNQLSKELGIAKISARAAVKRLEQEGFLKKKTYGKSWNITCDKDHLYNFTKKVAFNLGIVTEAYLFGLREHIHDVIENARVIVLFGSYRKGDDIETSDIDIAIEVVGDDDVKIHKLGVIPKLGFRKDVPVNLHVYSRNKINLNLFANIANGIVLEGFLEVKP